MKIVSDTNVVISGTFFWGGSKALYIVSGDKDLLDIGRYENVEMITAAEFCSRYLPL